MLIKKLSAPRAAKIAALTKNSRIGCVKNVANLGFCAKFWSEFAFKIDLLFIVDCVLEIFMYDFFFVGVIAL